MGGGGAGVFGADFNEGFMSVGFTFQSTGVDKLVKFSVHSNNSWRMACSSSLLAAEMFSFSLINCSRRPLPFYTFFCIFF
jgi:hypothetical protein